MSQLENFSGQAVKYLTQSQDPTPDRLAMKGIGYSLLAIAFAIKELATVLRNSQKA